MIKKLLSKIVAEKNPWYGPWEQEFGRLEAICGFCNGDVREHEYFKHLPEKLQKTFLYDLESGKGHRLCPHCGSQASCIDFSMPQEVVRYKYVEVHVFGIYVYSKVVARQVKNSKEQNI